MLDLLQRRKSDIETQGVLRKDQTRNPETAGRIVVGVGVGVGETEAEGKRGSIRRYLGTGMHVRVVAEETE